MARDADPQTPGRYRGPFRRDEDRLRIEAETFRDSRPPDEQTNHEFVPIKKQQARAAAAFDPWWKQTAKKYGPLFALVAGVGTVGGVLWSVKDGVDQYVVDTNEAAVVVKARELRVHDLERDMAEIRLRTTKMDAKLDQVLERLPEGAVTDPVLHLLAFAAFFRSGMHASRRDWPMAALAVVAALSLLSMVESP